MDTRVQTIVEFIRNNPSRDLSLTEAAEKVGLCASYLDHLFNQWMGISYTQYVIQLRLQLAAKLLRETFLKIINIGEQAGWKNPSYFNHYFKQHFGLTPLEYRQRHHQKNAQA